MRAIKQVVRRTAHLTALEAQAQRLPALVEALTSEDSAEGVRAHPSLDVSPCKAIAATLAFVAAT